MSASQSCRAHHLLTFLIRILLHQPHYFGLHFDCPAIQFFDFRIILDPITPRGIEPIEHPLQIDDEALGGKDPGFVLGFFGKFRRRRIR